MVAAVAAIFAVLKVIAPELAAEWEPEKFHDEFQDNLKKLIQTKLEGGEVAEVEGWEIDA